MTSAIPQGPHTQKDPALGISSSVVCVLQLLIILSLNLYFISIIWWANKAYTRDLEPRLMHRPASYYPMPLQPGFLAFFLTFWKSGPHPASLFPGWQCQGMFGRQLSRGKHGDRLGAPTQLPNLSQCESSSTLGRCHLQWIGAARPWEWKCLS